MTTVIPILFPMPKKARAYSYIRFSSAKQSEGDSLRRQTELSSNYAQKHGLILDTTLDLNDEGLSGFTGENRKRGALAVFLKAVESGIVKRGSFLLVESLDRLSRDTMSEQMSLFLTLINAGIIVVTLADEQLYSKANVDADMTRLMMSLVVMMRAHEESLQKSKRLKAVWAEKRKNAGREKITGQCPAWLKLNEDRKSFSVVKERAALVQRIYSLNISGVGHHSIARILNEENIPNWGRGTNGWHAGYVAYLLRTKAVIGEFQPCRRERGEKRQVIPTGDPIPDYYPAIIDLATWQKSQARRKTSTPGRTGNRIVNLFGGLAYDGSTGSPMRFMSRSPRKDANGERTGRWHYLVSDYARLTRKAKPISWRYEWFEAWFLDYVTRLDWSTVAQEQVPAQEIELHSRIAAQTEKLETIRQSRDRLRTLATSTANPPKTLIEDWTKLDAQETEVEHELAKMEAEADAAATRRNSLHESSDGIKSLIARGDNDARLRLREEIRRKIDRVDVFPHGIPAEMLDGGSICAPGSAAFKIRFANGVDRWVFCDEKKPTGEHAILLDTNLPAEEIPDIAPDEDVLDAAEVLQAIERGQPLPEAETRVNGKLQPKEPSYSKAPAQMDMVLQEAKAPYRVKTQSRRKRRRVTKRGPEKSPASSRAPASKRRPKQ